MERQEERQIEYSYREKEFIKVKKFCIENGMVLSDRDIGEGEDVINFIKKIGEISNSNEDAPEVFDAESSFKRLSFLMEGIGRDVTNMQKNMSKLTPNDQQGVSR